MFSLEIIGGLFSYIYGTVLCTCTVYDDDVSWYSLLLNGNERQITLAVHVKKHQTFLKLYTKL